MSVGAAKHDRKHRAKRLIAHPAAAVRVGNWLVGEQLLRFFREVTAGRGAFLRLVEGLLDRLAHFERHQAAQALLLGCEQIGEAEHFFATLSEGRSAVPLERGDGSRQLRVKFSWREGRKGPHRFAGGGVDGREGHGASSVVPLGWSNLQV
jgi:hypothetical protein